MKKYIYSRETNGEKLFVDFTFLYKDEVPDDVKVYFIWNKKFDDFQEHVLDQSQIDRLTTACLNGENKEIEKFALYVMGLYVSSSAETEWLDSDQEEEYEAFLTMKMEDYSLYKFDSPMYNPLQLTVID